MWHTHFVILAAMPVRRRLGSLADGYQLFREARTGLLFLTPGSGQVRERPDFSDAFTQDRGGKADFPPLREFLTNERKRLAIQKHEVRWDLIRNARSLSSQLGLPVLVSEETDDDLSMTVMAAPERVEYLRFRTTHTGGVPVDVVYRSGHGFAVDPIHSREARATTDVAIEELFSVPEVSVRDFSEPKPSRNQAEHFARNFAMNAADYLDRFGNFELISSAEPRARQPSSLTVARRRATSALISPFVIVGMALVAIFSSGSRRAGNDRGLASLFFIGLTAIVGPILALLLLAR